jgi:HK97 family phage major capsid protein
MTALNERDMKEQRAAAWDVMKAIVEKAQAEKRGLTPSEAIEYDKRDAEIDALTKDLDPRFAKFDARNAAAANVAETRGVCDDSRRTPGSVEGRTNEPIKPGQMREWYNKAVQNNVSMTVGSRTSGETPRTLRSQGTDRDLNRYFAEAIGFAKPTVESRALLEDTSGSSLAITPQSWVADYVDVLLPNTILGRVGAQVVPMSTEYVNVPVFTSTVSPQWVAEAGSISLDANPAFSQLQLIAMGGFKDTTLVSIEAAQDAYIQGGLPDMLAQAVAKKMAVVLDTSMLLGVSSNTGIPGLVNESGFVTRHYTGDAGTTGHTPADTTEIGVIAEQIVKKNVAVQDLAFVSNIGVHESVERLPVSAYGRYWDNPPIAANIPWITSENSALPYVETDPATATSVAQSGGSYSSLYCGPWGRFCVVGVHLDLQTQWLKERYIDSGEVGLFSFMRYSIRFAHPETFSRTIGFVTP